MSENIPGTFEEKIFELNNKYHFLNSLKMLSNFCFKYRKITTQSQIHATRVELSHIKILNC